MAKLYAANHLSCNAHRKPRTRGCPQRVEVRRTENLRAAYAARVAGKVETVDLKLCGGAHATDCSDFRGSSTNAEAWVANVAHFYLNKLVLLGRAHNAVGETISTIAPRML